MKKNNTGISMISLIVIIVSVIILSAVAITAGYHYIEESQRSERTVLTTIIAEAAYRRQNDYNLDFRNYYEGYIVPDEEQINTDNFRNLPENFEEEKSKIDEELNGVAPVWFILDGESALSLGVQETSKYQKYITEKVLDVEEEEGKYVPVALVEYVTGRNEYTF